jgi:hypothetical protein
MAEAAEPLEVMEDTFGAHLACPTTGICTRGPASPFCTIYLLHRQRLQLLEFALSDPVQKRPNGTNMPGIPLLSCWHGTRIAAAVRTVYGKHRMQSTYPEYQWSMPDGGSGGGDDARDGNPMCPESRPPSTPDGIPAAAVAASLHRAQTVFSESLRRYLEL